MRGNKSLRGTSSQMNSPSGSDDDEAKSPDEAGDEKPLQLQMPKLKTPVRGRKGRASDEMEA